jgi:hypothetical protein
VFGQNHLFVKILFKQGFHYSKVFQRFQSCSQVRRIQNPCQPSERRVIPSRRPSVHCSIRPDDVSYRLDTRQTKHHPSGRSTFSIQTSTISRSYCSSIVSVRTSQQPVRTSISDRSASDSFQVHFRKDFFNHPDDMDSRPDTLIHKARIPIQTSPSGRQSALVRTCVLQLRKLPIRLQPSRRLPTMVQTCA